MGRPFFFAAFLTFLGLFTAVTSQAADNVAITAKAREHFKAGVAYIDDPSGPKYEEAYREFHLAYAESPTYRILTNIGLCALNLERDGEAIEAYKEYLAHATEADIPKPKRALMERDVSTLSASLVRIAVTSSPRNVVLVDERVPSKGSVVTNRYELSGGHLSVGIHPGHHVITAKAEGFEPQVWEFEVNSATSHEHAFELKPPKTVTAPAVAPAGNSKRDESPSALKGTSRKQTPTLVYAGLAATGVFAISATVTGLMANAKESEYDEMNKTGANASAARELRNTVERLDLMTDIGIGATILAATGTAILYFMPSSEASGSTSAKSSWKFAPAVGVQLAGVSMSGQF